MLYYLSLNIASFYVQIAECSKQFSTSASIGLELTGCPIGPWSPGSPLSPASPTAPRAPCGPCGPGLPVTPVGPDCPGLPGAPKLSRQHKFIHATYST